MKGDRELKRSCDPFEFGEKEKREESKVAFNFLV